MKGLGRRLSWLLAALTFFLPLGSLSPCLSAAAQTTAAAASGGTADRLSDSELERFWLGFGEDAVLRRVDIDKETDAIPNGCERTDDGIRIWAGNTFETDFSYNGEDGQYAVVLEYKVSGDPSGINPVKVGIGNTEYETVLNPVCKNVRDNEGSLLSETRAISYLTNAASIDGEPLLFKITNGVCFLKLLPEQRSITLCSLLLVNPASLRSYDGYLHTLDDTRPGQGKITLKAEDYRATSDSGTKVTDGVLGSTTSRISGQKTLWKFTVQTAGVYSLAFRYRQTSKSELPVYRTVEIDGLPPFAEAENICFEKTAFGGVRTLTFGNGKQSYGVYLTAGVHTVALTAVNEPVGQIYTQVNSISSRMKELSDKIRKLKGKDDESKWRVTDNFPNIVSTLSGWSDQLNNLYDSFKKIDDTQPRYALGLKIAAGNLRKLAENPQNIQNHLDLLDGGALSADNLLNPLLKKLSDQSLGLCEIYVYAAGDKLPVSVGPTVLIGIVTLLIIGVIALFIRKARRPQKSGKA